MSIPERPVSVPETNDDVIAIFRANGGQVPSPYDDPPPMVLLHTIGRRSGREHVVPMRAMEDGDSLYVFASAHGSPTHPDWYLNLLAHPRIVIEKGPATIPVLAGEVTGEERDRIFARQVARFPVFAELEVRAGRRIPVIRLDPDSGRRRVPSGSRGRIAHHRSFDPS